MKIIALEILVICLFLLALTNYKISIYAYNFSPNSHPFDTHEMFERSLSGMPYHPENDVKYEQTETFKKLNKISFNLFLIALTIFCLFTAFLIFNVRHIKLNHNISLILVVIPWFMIIANYFIFRFWLYQNIGNGLLFSGYGFSPNPFFNIIWISKNLFTLISFIINHLKKESKKYCYWDFVLSNLVLFFMHESIAYCYPIFDIDGFNAGVGPS